jgi:hypothetical protein
MPEIKSDSHNPELSRFSLFGLVVDDGSGPSDSYGHLGGFDCSLVGGRSYPGLKNQESLAQGLRVFSVSLSSSFFVLG